MEIQRRLLTKVISPSHFNRVGIENFTDVELQALSQNLLLLVLATIQYMKSTNNENYIFMPYPCSHFYFDIKRNLFSFEYNLLPNLISM